MTTARYADTSTGEAASNDVVLIEGRALAQFLTLQRVGIVENISSGQPMFAEDAFDAWLEDARQRYRRPM
jgi:restriction endonuclease Mrr